MEEIGIEELAQKAREWHAAKKRWHFHLLLPDCVFNAKKGKHAFVIENCTDEESFAAYTEERQLALGKQLVGLLYGEKILKDEKLAGTDYEGAKNKEKLAHMLSRAAQMNAEGVQWHHHMLFPNCIFSDAPQKWKIVFEDAQTGEVIEAVFEKEPVEALRQMEILYYKQKK